MNTQPDNAPPTGPLVGRTIVTTRAERGAVDVALGRLGADVLHMPLIATVDPTPSVDGRSELRRIFDDLAPADGTTYIAVTSAAGARRVDGFLLSRDIALAAVGTATASILAERAGRAVDIVPKRQTAADLVNAFPDPQPDDRVVVAQADRAAPTLVDGLRRRGYEVVTAVVYRTELLTPDTATIDSALASDAVVFASGSAAEAWAQTIGRRTPPHVIVIGPTTAAVAAQHGLDVTTVATDHSVDGLVAATVDALTR